MDPRVKPGDDGFFIRPSKKLDRPHIPRGRSGGRSLLNRRGRANRPLLPVGMTSQMSSESGAVSGDSAALSDALADARAALHSVFGFDSFRAGQAEIVQCLLGGADEIGRAHV